MTNPYRERWTRARVRGKKRFIWLSGVIGWEALRGLWLGRLSDSVEPHGCNPPQALLYSVVEGEASPLAYYDDGGVIPCGAHSPGASACWR